MSEHNSKPLYSLTVGEYIELNKRVFSEEASKLLDQRQESKESREDEDIIFTDEVLILTGYKKSTLYTKVSRFEIPVLSRRKPLTFSRSEIILWIKEGKPNVLDKEADAFMNHSKNRKHE